MATKKETKTKPKTESKSKTTTRSKTTTKTKAKAKPEREAEIARTNRYIVDINWDEFFKRFRLFKIEIECDRLKHHSVYDCLSQIVKDGTPVTVGFGVSKAVQGKEVSKDSVNYRDKVEENPSDLKDVKIFNKEYHLLVSADSSLNRYAIQKALEPLSVKAKTVVEIDTEDDFPYPSKIMNMLLGYLPNFNVPGYYANGKFYIGKCLGWNKNLEKYGELSFLNVYFSICSGNILNLNGETATFTREDKFLTCKDPRETYFISPDGILNGKHKPYYATQDQHHAFVSRIHNEDNLDRYYQKKTKPREDVHNLIRFLDYSDKESFKGCGAVAMENIIEMMRQHYGDFLYIEQMCIETEFLEPQTGIANIKPELDHLKKFLKEHEVYVGVYDMNRIEDKDTAKEVLRILELLANPITKEDYIGLRYVNKIIDVQNDFGSIPENAALIRIMPLQEKENKMLKGMSETHKKHYLSLQRTNKMLYVSQGIAVQDFTLKGLIKKIKVKNNKSKNKNEEEVEFHSDDDLKRTIYNLLRQLSVKYDVIRQELPPELLERYKGTTIYYGEKAEKSNSYDMISMEISSEGEVIYSELENYPYDKKLGYILYDGVRIETIISGGYSRDRLFVIKKDSEDLEIQILDTNDFVFPNLDYIRKYLEAKQNPRSLKNNGLREKALGVYVEVHYWKNDDEQSLSYTSGIRRSALTGKRLFKDKKTLIREVKTNRDITPQVLEDMIIGSLEEGWLRKNDNSAHPAIFKFLHEAMELERTKAMADTNEVRRILERLRTWRTNLKCVESE